MGVSFDYIHEITPFSHKIYANKKRLIVDLGSSLTKSKSVYQIR